MPPVARRTRLVVTAVLASALAFAAVPTGLASAAVPSTLEGVTTSLAVSAAAAVMVSPATVQESSTSTVTISGTSCVPSTDPMAPPTSVYVQVGPTGAAPGATPLILLTVDPNTAGNWSVSTLLASNGSSTFPLTPGVYDVDSTCDHYTDQTAYATASLTITPTFADVPTNATFYTQIQWMYEQSISTGYLDSSGVRTYHPSEDVSRRAMAAFLYRAAASPTFVPPTVPSFSDVPTNALFYKEIEWMKSQGITTGNADGTFAPDAAVSRQAMAAFLYRFDGSPAYTPPTTASFSDVAVGSTFFAQIEWMKTNHITNGNADGTYTPLGAVSRQAMAAFLQRNAGS